MKSEVEKRKNKINHIDENTVGYWQHKGGQILWEISEGNVDFSGVPSEYDKITWPKAALFNSPGGQNANNL